MLNTKLRPGPKPKVSPEAPPAKPVVAAPPIDPPRHLYQAPEVPPERSIEVEILRKYAPQEQNTEIQAIVLPGTILKLPVAEATRVLKLGIARATDDTFKE